MLLGQAQSTDVRHRATHDALCNVLSQRLGVHHEIVSHAPCIAEIRQRKSSQSWVPVLAVHVIGAWRGRVGRVKSSLYYSCMRLEFVRRQIQHTSRQRPSITRVCRVSCRRTLRSRAENVEKF
jgi:hypothetical protein